MKISGHGSLQNMVNLQSEVRTTLNYMQERMAELVTPQQQVMVYGQNYGMQKSPYNQTFWLASVESRDVCFGEFEEKRFKG